MTELKPCPKCQKQYDDNWPIEIEGEIKLGGCQECWEKQCSESWHDFAVNIDIMITH